MQETGPTGNASNAYLNKILVLQKRVLRLIYFTDRREHAIPLFIKAKVRPVTFLYYEAVSKLMFEVHNQSAPINILKLFTKTSHIHTYNTRSSKSQLFSTKHSRLKTEFARGPGRGDTCHLSNLDETLPD